jgi:hypothetical protein
MEPLSMISAGVGLGMNVYNMIQQRKQQKEAEALADRQQFAINQSADAAELASFQSSMGGTTMFALGGNSEGNVSFYPGEMRLSKGVKLLTGNPHELGGISKFQMTKTGIQSTDIEAEGGEIELSTNEGNLLISNRLAPASGNYDSYASKAIPVALEHNKYTSNSKLGQLGRNAETRLSKGLKSIYDEQESHKEAEGIETKKIMSTGGPDWDPTSPFYKAPNMLQSIDNVPIPPQVTLHSRKNLNNLLATTKFNAIDELSEVEKDVTNSAWLTKDNEPDWDRFAKLADNTIKTDPLFDNEILNDTPNLEPNWIPDLDAGDYALVGLNGLSQGIAAYAASKVKPIRPPMGKAALINPNHRNDADRSQLNADYSKAMSDMANKGTDISRMSSTLAALSDSKNKAMANLSEDEYNKTLSNHRINSQMANQIMLQNQQLQAQYLKDIQQHELNTISNYSKAATDTISGFANLKNQQRNVDQMNAELDIAASDNRPMVEAYNMMNKYGPTAANNKEVDLEGFETYLNTQNLTNSQRTLLLDTFKTKFNIQ